MANTKSALKRIRQTAARRDGNRSCKSQMRTEIKKLRQTIAAGDAEAARELLPRTLQVIDKAAQKNAIHKNVAARTKSRLTRAVEKTAAS